MRLGIVVAALLLMAQAPLPPATQERLLQQKNEALTGKLLTLREHQKGALPPVLGDRTMEPGADSITRLKRANDLLTRQLQEADQQGYH